MPARILELGSLAVGSIVATTDSLALPSWLKSISLMSLVAFMVFQNIRQQNDLGKVIGKKDDQIQASQNRLEELIKADIRSRERLSDCLSDRPCLDGDHRTKET